MREAGRLLRALYSLQSTKRDHKAILPVKRAFKNAYTGCWFAKLQSTSTPSDTAARLLLSKQAFIVHPHLTSFTSSLPLLFDITTNEQTCPFTSPPQSNPRCSSSQNRSLLLFHPAQTLHPTQVIQYIKNHASSP